MPARPVCSGQAIENQDASQPARLTGTPAFLDSQQTMPDNVMVAQGQINVKPDIGYKISKKDLQISNDSKGQIGWRQREISYKRKN